MQNFSHILTKIIPKSSLWMFYRYFALKFKCFFIVILPEIELLNFHAFLHKIVYYDLYDFGPLKVCLHF
jgi:hypothetical protein